jgi:hypothetical protein
MSELPPAFNAFKHGGYSNLRLLPGENFDEFKALCRALETELGPQGYSELDVVTEIAFCTWRRARLHIYFEAAAARQKYAAFFAGRDDPSWDEHQQYLKFAQRYCQASLDVVQMSEKLAKAQKDLAASNEEVVAAAEKVFKVDVKKLMAEEDVTLTLASLGEQVTPETLMQEIDLYNRLEARIERLLKRLWQLKAAKQMLGLQGDASSPKTALETRTLPKAS